VVSQPRWYRLLIHTDASLSDEIVGIGYTIRVEDKTLENATFLEGNYSSMRGEFLAMKQAAETVAAFFEVTEHVFFYTDCQSLVDKLEDPDSEVWKNRRDSLEELLHGKWSVKWIPRERNNKADRLAHTGRDRGARRLTHGETLT
jgi:ribonuclease HI